MVTTCTHLQRNQAPKAPNTVTDAPNNSGTLIARSCRDHYVNTARGFMFKGKAVFSFGAKVNLLFWKTSGLFWSCKVNRQTLPKNRRLESEGVSSLRVELHIQRDAEYGGEAFFLPGCGTVIYSKK